MLEIVGVSKVFGRVAYTEVLKDVSLVIKDGEFVCITGPSGCGKTTLLNMIAGLTPPSSGRITINGKEVNGINPDVGYMVQRDLLFPWRTAIGNVEFGLEMKGLTKEEARQIALEILYKLGLHEFRNHYPYQLSGGMRQRVSLARTLVLGRPILLMDEPFANLDSQTRIMIENDLLNLWSSERKTVLFVTHDLMEAISLADRVVVMSKRPGRIKSEYRINLPRPRDVMLVRTQPAYREYVERIWKDLQEELDHVHSQGGKSQNTSKMNF